MGPRASDKRKKRASREAEKKAIELARYVIPVAAHTSMVHTLSGIVLHRLYRMMRTGDAPAESAVVVQAMVDHVRALDPAFFERVGEGPLDAADLAEARFPRTAGSGDVLAGLAASLLAGGLDARDAGSLAAFLHGAAGIRANPGGPVTAGAVADALPATVAAFLAGTLGDVRDWRG